MIPDCDGRSDGRSDGRTESIMARTALCIASYADALSKTGDYKFRPMSGWNGTVGSRSAFQCITHSLNPLKRDD